MTSSHEEYQRANAELRHLEDWLARLRRESMPGKDFTKAGVRKMIARLHEELPVYEAGKEVEPAEH